MRVASEVQRGDFAFRFSVRGIIRRKQQVAHMTHPFKMMNKPPGGV
ncbi:hypothetical protein RB12232 [Rhodopirellula baltica SH 1]|uniref:Uncharacterized protein n=1 Tax=Rhodopirellula baltica (strain DSM 10527 / NCIMB 13988 / SH1) TaxID=243090 RepID=Q7UIZ5_RHOBA|nr:hypothetical protein RB12232 [Rhodopirellula baltica SH 1]